MVYSTEIVHCYGITKDPETNNFMMVMEYIKNGSLRQHLNNNFNSLDRKEKVNNLYHIALGLEIIHVKGLIHHYFHCGNILCDDFDYYITDLGLCMKKFLKVLIKKYMEYYLI